MRVAESSEQDVERGTAMDNGSLGRERHKQVVGPDRRPSAALANAALARAALARAALARAMRLRTVLGHNWGHAPPRLER